ncbi:octopamine receptor beta-2R [Hydra vulgaris]|uniref:octopamine receptor beta-2R n=1 Tax=Hydra vulgaris TaxID=6087 RepID=UPI0006412205|nr:octopamine receptor beta-2R-like [Hydra vulgaris]XP_047135732.1 octopamine receptor beta-2R-like [Hydra vulgaris]
MDSIGWLKIISLFIIDITALIGNFLILFAGIKIKKLRKLQNAFIFNMAAADFLQALIIIPSAFISIYNSKWGFGFKSCQAFAIMKLTITLTSVFSLAGISLQRYFFVVKQTYRLNTKKSAACGITIVWIISLFFSLTPLFKWGELGFEPGKEVCTVLFQKSKSHTITIALFGLLFNIVIMVVCYLLIFKKLYHSDISRKLTAKSMEQTDCSSAKNIILNEKYSLDPFDTRYYNKIECQSPSSLSFSEDYPKSCLMSKKKFQKTFNSSLSVDINIKELQLLKTISIVVITFICCWVPYCVFNILRTLKIVGDIDLVDTITMWLGFLNSALNPLIYGVFNNQFKRSMVYHFPCHKIK